MKPLANLMNQRLRRRVRAAEKKASIAQMQLEKATSALIQNGHELRRLQADRELESAMVERIINLIRAVQPASALLPESLRCRSSFTAGDRYAAVRGATTYRELLHDLHTTLEFRPKTWERLMIVTIKDNRAERRHDLHLKFSETYLEALLCHRELFVAEVGRDVGQALHAAITKEPR